MNYVVFVGTEGAVSPEKLEFFRREWPAWEAERERQGVHLAGRELDLPTEGVITVRVRNGEPLLIDGPFAETKEYLGGFDLLECADLSAAIAAASKSPVLRYHPNEIRELPAGLTRGAGFDAFGASDDLAGVPYLLATWTDGAILTPDDGALTAAWRSQLDAEGIFVAGAELAAEDTALTLRFDDGEIKQLPGPFVSTQGQLAALDVVRGADLNRAAMLAVSHPLAVTHAVEVRSFYSDGAR